MDSLDLLRQAVAGNAADKLRRLAEVLDETAQAETHLLRGVRGDLEALALLELAAAA